MKQISKTKKMSKIIFSVLFMFCMFCAQVSLNTATAHAASEYTPSLSVAAKDWAFLENGDTSAFNSVQKTVDNTSAGIYNIVKNIAIAVLVIGVVFIGMGFAIGGGRKREESKTNIIWWVIGGLLILGAFTALGYVATVADGLATTSSTFDFIGTRLC